MSSSATLSEQRGAGVSAARSRDVPTWRLLLAGVAVVQLAALLVLSVHQWGRGSLTLDFGIFHQASTMIGRGDLDPFSTFAAHPFWRDQFNVLLWPLALVGRIFGSGLFLLVVQDLAIAASTWVLLTWATEVCDGVLAERPFGAKAIVAGAAALALVNPWTWNGALFDFHMQPLAGLFLLLAGRAFWRAHRLSPWIWVAATLATGTSGGVFAVGLGLALLISGRRRRAGAAVVAAGLGWLVLVVALDAHKSTPLALTYGYLAGTSSVGAGLGGLWSIASGVVLHPGRVVHMLSSRAGTVYTLTASGGMLGILTGVGLGVAGLDILVNGLNSASVFFALPVGGFQNGAAVLFMLVGSVIFLCWLQARGRSWSVVALILGLVVLVQGLVTGIVHDLDLRGEWFRVSAPAGALIDHTVTRMPADAEVVSSQGVVGRFAGRKDVFILVRPNEGISVCSDELVFVLASTQGIEGTDPATIGATERYLLRQRGGQLLGRVPGLSVVALYHQRPGGLIVLPNVPRTRTPPSPLPCA